MCTSVYVCFVFVFGWLNSNPLYHSTESILSSKPKLYEECFLGVRLGVEWMKTMLALQHQCIPFPSEIPDTQTNNSADKCTYRDSIGNNCSRIKENDIRAEGLCGYCE